MSPLIALMMVAAPASSPEPVGRAEMAYPFPSPDGQTIAFQGNFDGRWQLYAITAADGAIRRLHVSGNDDTHPAFSPDGTRLAFISNRDGNDEVYMLDLASGEARAVAPHPGKDGHPKWSADGAWLIFNRTFDPADPDGDLDSAILRVRPDGTGLEVLSDSPLVETFPSFAPDGRAILFVEWHPDEAGNRNRNGELVIVDLDSGRRRNITNSPGFEAYPFWGPSGAWIYFATAVASGSGRESVAFRISPDGNARQPLTPVDGRNAARPIPNQSETHLFFNVTVDDQILIQRIALPAAERVSG